MKVKKNNNEDLNVSKTEFISAMKGVLNNPQKFYYLLMLSGYSASRAQNLMFDLKYPKLRMASPTARKKVIKTLTNLINAITGDNVLYSRFRSLSRDGLFEQEGEVSSGMTTSSGIPGMGVPSVEVDPPFGSIPGLFKYVKKHAKNKKNNILINHMARRASL